MPSGRCWIIRKVCEKPPTWSAPASSVANIEISKQLYVNCGPKFIGNYQGRSGIFVTALE